MNTDLRKQAKGDFEKDFFKLMNNSVFGKTIENTRKHRDMKLVTTERRRNYLVSESNYHITNFFTEHLLAIEMKKTEILINKPFYAGHSILKLSKILMYEFWYDYVKTKYGENAKLCYKDTDSFIIYIKTDDIYKELAEDVEIRFDTSSFEMDRPSPKGKNRKVITYSKIKNGNTYSYLKDNNDEDKKAKGTKKCIIKRKLTFQDYKNCLEAAQLERKINYLEINKFDVDSLKEDVAKNKLTLKT